MADDSIVWEYAKSEGYTIVTKDNDFNNLVSLFGIPLAAFIHGSFFITHFFSSLIHSYIKASTGCFYNINGRPFQPILENNSFSIFL